jgi:hypothetical protein
MILHLTFDVCGFKVFNLVSEDLIFTNGGVISKLFYHEDSHNISGEFFVLKEHGSDSVFVLEILFFDDFENRPFFVLESLLFMVFFIDLFLFSVSCKLSRILHAMSHHSLLKFEFSIVISNLMVSLKENSSFFWNMF